MGLVLLPIFIGTLVAFVISIKSIFKRIKDKQFNYISILLSPFVIGIIYLNHIFYWIYIGRVYAFEPFFMLTFFCIVVPFFLSKYFESTNTPYAEFLSDLLKCLIIVSVVTFTIFYRLFDIQHFIDVEIYY